MCDEEISAMVVDNGSGMCKASEEYYLISSLRLNSQRSKIHSLVASAFVKIFQPYGFLFQNPRFLFATFTNGGQKIGGFLFIRISKSIGRSGFLSKFRLF